LHLHLADIFPASAFLIVASRCAYLACSDV